MREALDEDQELNYESALELYTQAIELCIEAVSDLTFISLNKIYNCFHFNRNIRQKTSY